MAKTRFLPLFLLLLFLAQSCGFEDRDWMFYGRGPFKLSVEITPDRPVAEITYSVKRDIDLMDPSADPVIKQKVLARAAIMEMLRYFDIKNFAGYNNVTSEKSYLCVPTCGHAIWAEPTFIKARDEFFGQF